MKQDAVAFKQIKQRDCLGPIKINLMPNPVLAAWF